MYGAGLNAQSEPLRVLNVAEWSVDGAVTGSVAALEWTPDYLALAVGWQHRYVQSTIAMMLTASIRGLVVWSAYGCKLMSTLPSTENVRYAEPLANGVSSIVRLFTITVKLLTFLRRGVRKAILSLRPSQRQARLERCTSSPS